MNEHESDLLIGHETDELIIKSIEGELMETIQPPKDGWTHDSLESLYISQYSPNGWDAYLGTQWIGSSEI